VLVVPRPDEFLSNGFLYKTGKSPGLSATLFDKEGFDLWNFVTPFIKLTCTRFSGSTLNPPERDFERDVIFFRFLH
jgi:hypothetical protein